MNKQYLNSNVNLLLLSKQICLAVLKTFPLALLLILCSVGSAWAQNTQSEGYQKEFTYGINFNTNGRIIGGASLRSSHTIKDKWQQFWGLEIVEVKHPKENPYMGLSGDLFVLGKSNYFFVVRPEFGREYTFFRKAPESGVEVNGILAVGPSLGLQVPYYIVFDSTKYVDQNGVRYQVGPTDYRTEPYDPINAHSDLNRIRGSAGFLTGLRETDIKIGAHIKAALSFEYGRYQENITGIEVGFLVEAYPKKIIMIPQAENYNTFTSVYLTLYYGSRK